jgi:hypothetical protein
MRFQRAKGLSSIRGVEKTISQSVVRRAPVSSASYFACMTSDNVAASCPPPGIDSVEIFYINKETVQLDWVLLL